jgi:hypothetical protein
MDRAFSLIRDRGRSGNRRLSDLAQAFVDGTDALTRPDPRAHPGSLGVRAAASENGTL